MSTNDLVMKVEQLKELENLLEEVKVEAEAIRDEIKQEMMARDTEELEAGKYILLSAHREENIDIESNFMSLMTAVNAMAEKYDMPILYSCHPRSRKYIEQRKFKFDKRVIQHQPLGFFDYNKLQMNSYCVLRRI